MPFHTGTPGSPKDKVVIPSQEHTPNWAKSKAGAKKFAEENTVTETTPSGHIIAGPAGTSADVSRAKHGRKRVHSILRDMEHEQKWQAKEFESHALSHLAKTHFKTDSKGKVEFKTEKIPKIKTSPKAISIETKKLNTAIRVAKVKGASTSEIKALKSLGSQQIAVRNYEIHKGKIQYRKVKVPKLKTSPKKLRRDIHTYTQAHKEIEEGSRKFFPTLHPGVEETSLIGGAISAAGKGIAGALDNVGKITIPTSEHTSRSADLKKGAAKAVPEVGKVLGEAIRAQGRAGAKVPGPVTVSREGFAASPGISPGRSALMQGVRAGIPLGTEYLTRPGMAVEAYIAQQLSSGESPLGEALLSKRAKQKLAKAAGPLDVLLHGHKAKHAITGGDLGEALFGAKQLGLPIDIVTEPLSYFTFAALPAEFGERAAALTARLAEQAPAALKDVKYVRLAENAAKSGDHEAVVGYLEDLAKKYKVSTLRLGKRKAEREAIKDLHEAVIDRSRSIAHTVEEGRAKGGIVRGENIHVSGKGMQEAVNEMARFNLRRQIKPGIQVEIRPLLLKKVGAINIPLPARLAHARIIPRIGSLGDVIGRAHSTDLLKEARSMGANSEVYRELADEHQHLLDKYNQLHSNPTTSIAERNAIGRELTTFEDKMRSAMMQARDKNLTSPKFASLQEVTSHVNAKRFSHELWRVTRTMGTQTQHAFFESFKHAIEPIIKDKVARGRVGLHMLFEADTGMRPLLDAVPLSAKEAGVLSNVRTVLDEMKNFGFETGTLQAAVENYFYRDWSTADDVLGPLNSEAKYQTTKPMGGKRGSKSAPMMHRNMAEALAMADKQKIAKLIRTVAPGKMSLEKSLELAELGHQFSTTRFAAEDLAQHVLRGGVIREDILTPIQKKALIEAGRWESKGVAIPALFRDLEQTEGVVKLNPKAFEFHNLVEDPFGGMSTREELRIKMASALESEAKIKRAMEFTPKDSKLYSHYEELLKQRRGEISELQAARESSRGILPSQQKELDALEEMKKRGMIPEDFKQEAALKAVPDAGPDAAEVRDKLTRIEAEHKALEAELDEHQRGLKKRLYKVEPQGAKPYVAERFSGNPEADIASIKEAHAGGAKVKEDVPAGKIAKRETAEKYAKAAKETEDIENQLETARREHDELNDKPWFEADHSSETRVEAPPKVPFSEEAPTAKMVGLANDAELPDFVPNATEDYIGTLKDFRREHPDYFPVIDPLLSNFKRTRHEGLALVHQLRWRALDASVGRDLSEAQGSRYVLSDGRTGPSSNIRMDFGEGPHTTPIAYILKDTNERIDPASIEFPGRTLIPNKEYALWYDPVNGREYAPPSKLDSAVGGAIEDATGPGRLWPTDVIQNVRAEFFRMGEGGMTDLYDSGLETAFQRVMSMQRYGVTTLFPAFTVRNAISDMLLSTLADPGVWFHPIANAKVNAVVMTRGGKVKLPGGIEFGVGKVKVPGIGPMNSEDFLATMHHLGLQSGQHMAEMVRLVERGDVKEVEKWLQKNVMARPTQIVKGGFGLGPSGAIGRRMVEFNARAQDVPRIVTFMQRLRRNGGDFADALYWSIKHHFDYGDLTMFERRYMRNLFLFYTWYRKNIPLQFLSVVTRPGFFSGVTNAYLDLAKGQTPLNFNWSKINPMLPNMEGELPHGGLIPDYMINQLAAVTTNWNGHALSVGFGAPWADMNLITHPLENLGEGARSFAGLFNPALSLPYILATQKDLLTGRTFNVREGSGPASILDWVAKKFGLPALPTDDSGNPALPWQVNLAFNQVPILNRGLNYFRPPSATEDPGRLNQMFGGGVGSFITGLNAYVSPKDGERLDAAYISRVLGRAAQRKSLAEQGGNESDLRAFDKQTIQWAKQLGIPFKYLQATSGIGPAYVTQEERKTFHLSGGSPLAGGTSGKLNGLLGGEGGLGGLTLPSKAHEGGASEEALRKLMHPNEGEEAMLHPLGSSVLPIGEEEGRNALVSGAEAGSTSAVNQAEFNLKANRQAREEAKHPKIVRPSSQASETAGPFLRDQVQQREAQKEVNSSAKKMTTKTIISSIPTKPTKPHHANKKIANELADWGLNPEKVAALIHASKKTGVPASLLASIGKYESTNGTSTLPGVHSGTNSAGAAGPFQFLISTWESVAPEVWGDQWKGHSPYNYKDEALAAGHLLRREGYDGTSAGTQKAVFSYNHAQWYVNEVVNSAVEAQHLPWNKATDALQGGGRMVKVKADAAGMLKWADATVGTQEGTKLQARWAAKAGISSGTAWCSAWIAAGLARHGLPMPANPAYSNSWAEGWKGGDVIGHSLSQARPGDILSFSGSHVGLYVGNGEMISGNFGDEVHRGPVSEESAGLSAVVRPHYKGGWVKVEDEPFHSLPGATSVPGSGGGTGLTTNVPAETVHLELGLGPKKMERKILGAGTTTGLSSTGTSSTLGTGSFLTNDEAGSLGKSASKLAKQAKDILAAAERPAVIRVATPKFGLKSGKM